MSDRQKGHVAGAGHDLVKLRRKLAELRRIIADNERIWAGFRDIENRLVAARSLNEVVGCVTQGLRATFPAVSAVTVCCIDEEYRLQSPPANFGSCSTKIMARCWGPV